MSDDPSTHGVSSEDAVVSHRLPGWFAVLPLLVAIGVSTLAGFIYSHSPGGPLVLPNHWPTESLQLPQLAAQFAWTNSFLALTVAWAAALLASIVLAIMGFASGTRRQIVYRSALAGVAVLCAVIAANIHYSNWEFTIGADLVTQITDRTGTDIDDLFRCFDPLLSDVTIYAVAGSFAILLVPLTAAHSRAVVAQSLRRQRALFIAASVLLTIATIEINLLWSWPAAWTHDTDVADAITSAAHQVAAANGVFYSVILFAVAGVTLIPTYAHARRVAAGEDAEAGQQWLSAAGIDGGLLKFLEVGLALLAPALAGSAFSSVFSVLRG